ncbi:DUF1700 domain-containing protein [Weissella diestrammenae]|uniref:DUF1700 domain-containing protein n=1 Tax=Weissella diestrammenae TaxID=1162633 RepID=A0A7G9T7A6_9LACO|nr:DUF1700 domain-containing protein [Weissella diestrammenae]MCM0581991.1 DUF1700 domain-containing protein [Weissella diestrammenae]QNN75981.1 DUF1700 domain-containing protein [Weissella diestrammenae]
MKSNIYFSQLAGHLEQLPASERQIIIENYRQYADKNELSGEKLIQALGTPKQLARRALIDYSIDADLIAENAVPVAGESFIKRNRRRLQRQLNLLGLVVVSLAPNIAWYPAMLIIFAILFGMAVIMAILAVIVLLSLGMGIYQIIAGLWVLRQDWSVSLFQGGIGVALIGLQFIAWPVMIALLHGLMNLLMMYTKSVGRRFSNEHQLKEVQHD